eukprot:scaffold90010_cov71-Phaeocystis_antarctica.AAC.4
MATRLHALRATRQDSYASAYPTAAGCARHRATGCRSVAPARRAWRCWSLRHGVRIGYPPLPVVSWPAEQQPPVHPQREAMHMVIRPNGREQPARRNVVHAHLVTSARRDTSGTDAERPNAKVCAHGDLTLEAHALPSRLRLPDTQRAVSGMGDRRVPVGRQQISSKCGGRYNRGDL